MLNESAAAPARVGKADQPQLCQLDLTCHADSVLRPDGLVAWRPYDGALKTLEARELDRSPLGASGGVKAAVLKVPHHGAKNAWFSTMAESFTRCQPDDVLVVSAGGGPHRPHPQVWNYWLGTGKRLRGTWQPASTPSRGRRLGGWAADDIALLATRVPIVFPHDLEILIPSEGPIEVKEHAVPRSPITA